jgi:putative hemolysin
MPGVALNSVFCLEKGYHCPYEKRRKKLNMQVGCALRGGRRVGMEI